MVFEGYDVVNVNYLLILDDIDVLVYENLLDVLLVCGDKMIDIVIYFMGGIFVWVYLVDCEINNLGCVVMMGLFN